MDKSPEYDRKLSISEAAALLGVSPSWLNKLRGEGRGPTFLKLGRRVLYDGADLETWAKSTRQIAASRQYASARIARSG